VDWPLVAALRRAAPVVLTMHDSNPFNAAPSSRLQRLGAFAALGSVDRIIVHTAQGRARLEARGVPAGRIAQVPHGLLGADDAAAGAPHGAVEDPGAEPCFLLFGKIKPYKGTDTLIRAFAALPGSLRARARVRVVGKAYMDVAPLEALARECGVAERVGFDVGFVPDEAVPALFGAGSIAVFPYREIDSSGVLALAMRYARPAIASRIGGFAETLEDGRHALLVPPDDVAALSAAMARMIEEPALRAASARAMGQLAGEIPSWREIGARTAAVYAAARADWEARRA
jgi:glycosyltransferase involved in cell wall biosynthesis